MATAASVTQPRAEAFAFLIEAFAASAAVRAADRLGVLARLDAGPADLGELAAACAISERGAGLLLRALASLGLVEADQQGRWRAALPSLSKLGVWPRLCDGLDEVVRHGRPGMHWDTPDGAASLYPSAAAQLGTVLAGVAEEAARHLPAGPRVLDAGAGAAPWSLAVAARDPACRVTAFDLPDVLPATRRAVAAAGRAAQFRFAGGDLFSTVFDQAAYDLVIAGNLCHLFSEAANRDLLARLSQALRDGGALAVIDVVPDTQPASRSLALYELSLFLRTAHGQVYPLAAYEQWLHDAGLGPVERWRLCGQPPLTLLTARKGQARQS